ncbi:MAG: flippase-like domain-containing protein, partial [Cyclobacteriaceae bacterium]|nr:flippase-like domain-containing protein [Cyclobacteriaceae bacterium]
MSSKVRGIIQYIVLAIIAAVLLWLSFSSIKVAEGESKWAFMVKIWGTANIPFLFISAAMALLSHVIRAERWKLLLRPLGTTPSSKHSFLSVMIGYFVNLGIPRGGELSRCFYLYKLDRIPISVSFGTVLAERIIDLIFLLTLIGMAFLIELDNLLFFFNQVNFSSEGGNRFSITNFLLLGVILVFLGLLIPYLLYKFKKSWTIRMFLKAKKVFIGMKSGLTVVFRLESRSLFIVYSVLIWVLYYFMSYFVILAFPETEHLGFLSALSIFAIGGIAMAIPLPGGTGSYHVLVPLGLTVLFGIRHEEAVAFSFIFHGWQTLVIIIFGLLSL